MISRRLALCGAAVLALACAAPALAQTTPAASTKVAKDASGNTFNLAGQTDASGNFHYRDVFEGLTPAGAPAAAYVDANGLLHVSNDILAPNAATATNQTTANGYLQTLAGAVSGNTFQMTCTSGCSGSGGSVPTGTAGSPNAAVLTVQGAAGGAGTPLPVSGPLTSAQLTSAGLATAAGQTSIVTALTPSGGLPTAPSNAAQAHTDAAAIAAALAPSGGLPTSEKNSAAIAANTAPGGSGALTAIGTPATNGTALLAGSKGTELYLNANDTVTLAIEPAAVCGVSAPSYTATVQGGSSGAVIPEALTGQVMCVTAKTGTPGSRPY